MVDGHDSAQFKHALETSSTNRFAIAVRTVNGCAFTNSTLSSAAGDN